LKFAVVLSNFGTYADPKRSLAVAQAAEAAGWDGFFVWDHLAFVWGPPSADPWVTLAAVAVRTESLTLGTAVTPLARRRPQVVSQQAASVEALNGGRVVLGAGLGGNAKEFESFGEDSDPHVRARLLDDGLEVVRELWQGPIWIGGNSAPAQRRAARWDGWIPDSAPPDGTVMTPEDVARGVAAIGRGDDFDVATSGNSDPGDASLCAEYAAAGATWWFEPVHDRRFDADGALARVKAGPAR